MASLSAFSFASFFFHLFHLHIRVLLNQLHHLLVLCHQLILLLCQPALALLFLLDLTVVVGRQFAEVLLM